MDKLNITSLVRDYGDWQLEARTCRQECALFDFSFMSRVLVSGNEAESTLASFQNRRIDDMRAGQIRYGLRIDAANRVKSDLTIWRHNNGGFEVMSGQYTDIADLCAMHKHDLQCTDVSSESVIFAIQGSTTLMALRPLTDVRRISKLDYFSFDSINVMDIPCLVGRLGYTGELGVELIAPRTEGSRLWKALAEHALPAGFAAIDSLRIEAGFMLFANDIALSPTVSELNVDVTSSKGKDKDRFEFICCTAETEQDPVLWQSNERSPAPPQGKEIVVTSACFSTVANAVLVLGFSRPNMGHDQPLFDPTGNFTNIRRVSRPFYDPLKARPKGNFQLEWN